MYFISLQDQYKWLNNSPRTLDNVGSFVDEACYFQCTRKTRDACWDVLTNPPKITKL